MSNIYYWVRYWWVGRFLDVTNGRASRNVLSNVASRRILSVESKLRGKDGISCYLVSLEGIGTLGFLFLAKVRFQNVGVIVNKIGFL